MNTKIFSADRALSGAADVLIPVIRTAATIGFAIAPCSLGFVIIAVSEQLIRSIMVGEDPEMLISDLQNQFPNDAIQIIEDTDAGLVAKVVELIERSDSLDLPLENCSTDLEMHVIDGLQKRPCRAGQECGA
jgi:AraC family transcriptional regulator, regulatory protein of adaptative response / methylated-DNA-[protein]-cysteine methyltransferase